MSYLQELHHSFPVLRSPLGHLSGAADLLPKPVVGTVPLLAVGSAGQHVDWLAAHFDAFVTYPRARNEQDRVVRAWRDAVNRVGDGSEKPVAQSLYVDLAVDPWEAPSPIHLGHRLGRWALLDHLLELGEIGVRHVVLNLKYGSRPASDVVEEIGVHVLPALRGQEGACR